MAADLEILRTNLTKLRNLEKENLAVFCEKVEQGKVPLSKNIKFALQTVNMVMHK